MYRHRANYILDITDFAVIAVIFLSIAVGDILDWNLYGNMLRACALSVAAFHYGRTAYLYRDEPGYLWGKFFVFTGIFMFIGAMIDILTLDKRLLQSISDMVTMTKIPHCSGTFFTVAVMLFFVSITAKYTPAITRHKALWIGLSVLMLFVPLIVDEEATGYPLLGAIIGCTEFKCVPFIPAFAYFVVGIYSVFGEGLSRKTLGIGSLVLTLLGAALIPTALRPAGIYLTGAVVVFLSAMIIPELGVFKALLGIYDRIIAFMVKIIRGFIEGFRAGGRKNLPVYVITYTFAFAIITFFVFSVFRETGTSIIWKPDALQLYLAKAYSYSESMRDAFAGMMNGSFHIPDYDYNLGLGGAVTRSYEPLYIIFALFKPSQVELAYHVVLIARLYFAGIAASVLFLFYRNRYFESLIGSFVYVFSGFAIAEAVRHAQFLVPMIFLPLLILMTEEMLHKRRWWLCPPLIGLSLACGYYFHYINTLLIITYFIVRYLCLEEKSIKDFFVRTFRFAGAYILGVVIGNVTLTTTFASYLGSSRSGERLISTYSLFFYSKSWIKRCLGAFISLPDSPGYLVRFGFAAFALIAVIIVVTSGKKEHRFLRTMFIVLSVFCLFPFVGLAFNGFGAVINRWTYAYALLVAAMVVYVLPDVHKLSRGKIKIIFFVIMPFAAYLIIDREFRSISDAFSLMILFASFAIVLMMNEDIRLLSVKAGKGLIAILIGLSICLNGYQQYLVGADTTMDAFVPSGNGLSELTKTMLSEFEGQAEDSSKFERVATTEEIKHNVNASWVLNFHGTTEYSNTMNGAIIDYLCKMGTSSQSTVRINGFKSRTMLDTLANVKYYTSESGAKTLMPYGYSKIKETKNDRYPSKYAVYENEYALPFGYTYDRVIDQDTLEDYDITKRQELMLQAATVKNAGSSTASGLTADSDAKLGTSFNTKKLKITGYELENCKLTGTDTLAITAPTASVTLHFESTPESELYIRWDGSFASRIDQRDMPAYINATLSDGTSQDYTILTYNNAYNNGYGSSIYNLGYHKGVISSCTIRITSKDELTSDKEPGVFKLDKFGIYEQMMDDYPGYIADLSENHLDNLNVQPDVITGSLDVDREKLLVISLPYQKGWKAYIDDEEVPIEKANIMYMGLDVKKGKHDIRFEFERPGKQLSRIVTLAGLLIYVALLIYTRRKVRLNK